MTDNFRWVMGLAGATGGGAMGGGGRKEGGGGDLTDLKPTGSPVLGLSFDAMILLVSKSAHDLATPLAYGLC